MLKLKLEGKNNKIISTSSCGSSRSTKIHSEGFGKRKLHKSYSSTWITQISNDGFAKCLIESCNFISTDLQLMQDHYKSCDGIQKYDCNLCTLCSNWLSSEQELLIHKSHCKSGIKSNSDAIDKMQNLRTQGSENCDISGQSSMNFKSNCNTSLEISPLEEASQTVGAKHCKWCKKNFPSNTEYSAHNESCRVKSNSLKGAVTKKKNHKEGLCTWRFLKKKADEGFDENCIIQPGRNLPEGQYFRRRPYTKQHKAAWEAAIKRYKHINCIFQNCHFLALSLEDMISHFGYCNGDGSFAKFVCPYCEGRVTSAKILEIHICRSHTGENSNVVKSHFMNVGTLDSSQSDSEEYLECEGDSDFEHETEESFDMKEEYLDDYIDKTDDNLVDENEENSLPDQTNEVLMNNQLAESYVQEMNITGNQKFDYTEDHVYFKRKGSAIDADMTTENSSSTGMKIPWEHESFCDDETCEDEKSGEAVQEEDNEQEAVVSRSEDIDSAQNPNGSDLENKRYGRYIRQLIKFSFPSVPCVPRRKVYQCFTSLWTDSIKNNGFAQCLAPTCNFISLDIFHIQNHFKTCNGLPAKGPNLCTKCNSWLPSAIELSIHKSTCKGKTIMRDITMDSEDEEDNAVDCLGKKRKKDVASELQDSSDLMNERIGKSEVTTEISDSNKDVRTDRSAKKKSSRITKIMNLKESRGMDLTRIIQPGPVLPNQCVRRRRCTKQHRAIWEVTLREHKYIKCMYQNCNFLAMSLEDMIYHFGYCIGDGSFAKFECPYCKGRLTSAVVLEFHIRLSHSEYISKGESDDDDEITSHIVSDLKTYRRTSVKLKTDQSNFRPNMKYKSLGRLSDRASANKYCRNKNNNSKAIDTEGMNDNKCGFVSSPNNQSEIDVPSQSTEPVTARLKNDSLNTDGEKGRKEEYQEKSSSHLSISTDLNTHGKSFIKNTYDKANIRTKTNRFGGECDDVQKNSADNGPLNNEEKVTDHDCHSFDESNIALKNNTKTQMTVIENKLKIKTDGKNEKAVEKLTINKRMKWKSDTYEGDENVKFEERETDVTEAVKNEVSKKELRCNIQMDGNEENIQIISRRTGRKPKERSENSVNLEPAGVEIELVSENNRGRRGRKRKNDDQDELHTENNKSEIVKCVKCDFMGTRQQFNDHNFRKHIGLSWIEGEIEIDLEDKEAISFKIKQAFRFIKTATCEKCGTMKKSALGFITHIENCGKSQAEKEALKIKCQYCPSRVLKYSMPIHLRLYHSDSGGESYPKEITAEDECSSELPAKRKSAIRAVNKFHEVLKQYGDEDELGKEINYVLYEKGDSKFPMLPCKIRGLWKKMRKENKKIPCRRGSCLVESETLQDAKHHHFLCPVLPEKSYICLLCDYYSTTESSIIQHVNIHPKDTNSKEGGDFTVDSADEIEEDEVILEESMENEVQNESDCTRNKTKKKVDLSSDDAALETYFKIQFLSREGLLNERKSRFYKRSLRMTLADEIEETKENTFPLLDLSIKARDWISVTEESGASYLPSLEESIAFRVNGIDTKRECTWRKLKRFQGEIIAGSQYIFTGGSILAMSWCKNSVFRSWKKATRQYLAVSSSSTMDKYQDVNEKSNNKGLIQIWDFGNQKCLKKAEEVPKLAMGIVHESGEVWDLSWFPVDTYVNSENEEKLTRIGLLGAACADGTVKIWSICDPESLKSSSSVPLYKVEPSIILELEGCKNEGCLRVVIGKSGVVVGGYTKGLVAVWNLKNISSPFCKNNGKSLVLKPNFSFQAHRTSITALSICPTNDRYISTAGLDRCFKFWDLDCVISPFEIIHREVCLDTVWTRHWPITISTLEDIIPGAGKGMVKGIREGLCDKHRAPFTMESTCWGLSFNEWLNAICGCSNIGEVRIRYLRNMFKADENFRYKYGNIFLTTELKLLSGSKINMQDNPTEGTYKSMKTAKENSPVPRTYAEACNYFGLIFNDFIIKDDSKQRRTGKDSKPVSQYIEEYPITSVNKVCWNPNYNNFTYLAIGHQCGLIKVRSLEDAQSEKEISKFFEEAQREISKHFH